MTAVTPEVLGPEEPTFTMSDLDRKLEERKQALEKMMQLAKGYGMRAGLGGAPSMGGQFTAPYTIHDEVVMEMPEGSVEPTTAVAVRDPNTKTPWQLEDERRKMLLAWCAENIFFKLILEDLDPVVFQAMPPEPKAEDPETSRANQLKALKAILADLLKKLKTTGSRTKREVLGKAAAEAQRKIAELEAAGSQPSFPAFDAFPADANDGSVPADAFGHAAGGAGGATKSRGFMDPIPGHGPKRWEEPMRQIFPEGTILYGCVRVPGLAVDFRYVFTQDGSPPHSLTMDTLIGDARLELGNLTQPWSFQRLTGGMEVHGKIVKTKFRILLGSSLIEGPLKNDGSRQIQVSYTPV